MTSFKTIAIISNNYLAEKFAIEFISERKKDMGLE